MFVSPVWIILSAIDTSLLAVMIPTESMLVTSSYVRVPPTLRLPPIVAAPLTLIPPALTRTLSVPAVSTVNVSAAGNLMAVLVSPV